MFSSVTVPSWKNKSQRAYRLALLLAVLAVALAVAVTAGASAEDAIEAKTFGPDDVAGTNLGTRPYPAELTGLTTRPDGGLVVRQGNSLDSYLADGAPDPATPPVAVPAGRSFPAAGGMSYVLDGRKLTRLGSDGAPDPGFGEGGTIEAPRGTAAVVELASRKVDAITINLHGGRLTRTVLELVTLRPDGRAGVRQRSRLLVQPFAPDQVIREAVATPDGGALVVGGYFLLRLRRDGTLDEKFGSNGAVDSVNFAGAHLLAGGSIEAVGDRYELGPVVVRLSAAGRPVTSFGTKGVKVLEAADWKRAEIASWGADGSVIIGGRYEVPGEGCAREEGCEEGPALAAFDRSGDPETGFGEGGIVRLAALAGPSDDPRAYAEVGFGVTALTHRRDGSIVAAGNVPPNRQLGFLAALSPTGALLAGFGEAGVVRLPKSTPPRRTWSGSSRWPATAYSASARPGSGGDPPGPGPLRTRRELRPILRRGDRIRRPRRPWPSNDVYRHADPGAAGTMPEMIRETKAGPTM